MTWNQDYPELDLETGLLRNGYISSPESSSCNLEFMEDWVVEHTKHFLAQLPAEITSGTPVSRLLINREPSSRLHG